MTQKVVKSNILAGLCGSLAAGVVPFLKYWWTDMDREISLLWENREHINHIFDYWVTNTLWAGPGAAILNHKRSPKDNAETTVGPAQRPIQVAASTRPAPFFDDFEPDFDIGPADVPKKTVDQVAIVDMDQLYEDLERDEGVSHAIYIDSLGHPTVGIGHLLTKRDPESSLPVGSKVGHERVLEWFEQDIQTALTGAIKLFPELNSYPMEVRLVLTNMIFQLGYTGLSRFKKTRKYLESRQWAAAADEMMVSKWAEQTPYRAQRHSDRLKSIGSTQHA